MPNPSCNKATQRFNVIEQTKKTLLSQNAQLDFGYIYNISEKEIG
jgi:hypothetical protein